MKEFLEGLFLHFFIMMIIPLINIMMFRQKKSIKWYMILSVTIFIALLLTMIFPITIPDGIIFDMKFIPVYLAYFYVNPLTGILAIIEIIIFKSMSNLGSAIPEIINYSMIALLFYGAGKLYKKFTLRRRLLLPFLFYLPIMVTRFIYFLTTGRWEYSIYLVLFILVSSIALAVIIYLVEMHSIQASMMLQLQNADKLNAISQLAASVAHEIRNPMTSIRGFLQLMKDEKNLTVDQSTFISVSLSELDRTQNIINDFLSLARPTNNDFDKIDVSKQLHNIIDFMHPFAVLSNVELECQIEEDLFIEGNTNEFKQLGINIMKNGIEAMPSGGKLSVMALLSEWTVTISFKDSGSGMSKQQINQLGQPYYSTKTKGTGLGLMISFDIIKRMYGRYQIESSEKLGTCFTIYFPAKPIE